MTDATTASAPAGPPGEADGSSAPIAPTGAEAASEARRCGYSRCGLPLPDTPIGRKLDYCPHRSWPGRAGRDVTCRELGRAENLLRAVHGDEAIPDTTLIELGQHVAATLGPVQALLAALRTVGGQLDDVVTSALAARDAAKRQLAEERGLRLAAQQRTCDAEQDAAQARRQTEQHRRDKDLAEQAADRACSLQSQAEHARTAALSARDAAHDQARRADERAGDATARANDLQRQLADLGGELRTTKEQLAEARQRVTAESERAARAAADTATRLQQLEHAHAQALRDARQADSERHTAQISTLNQQIGRLEHRHTACSTERDQLRATIATWRNALIDALAQPTPNTGQDPVRTHVRRLLRDPQPDSPAAERP